MIDQLFRATSARSLDQKQGATSARRFVVDDRLCVTILTKTGVVALARYGMTGGAKLFPISSREARLLERRLDKLAG